MNRVQHNQLDVVYPRQPSHNSCCGVNEVYQTISPHQDYTTTAVGPATIKHLYTGIPNWYPVQKITRPNDTLYNSDYYQTHLIGSGQGKRIGYRYKPYPFTDRNVRETREYTDYILPYNDFRAWTKYPVIRDSSVNNPDLNEPRAY